MDSEGGVVVDETRPDKKAGLTRVPMKKQSVRVEEEAPAATPTPSTPEPFVPDKRLGTDMIPADEKWEAKRDREKTEDVERAKIVARMTPTEQLGLSAGRCAEKVKELRADLKFAEKRVAQHRQDLIAAEALLNARLDELRKVGT